MSKFYVSMLEDPLLRRTSQCDKYDNLLKEKEHCKFIFQSLSQSFFNHYQLYTNPYYSIYIV